ncbi:hypothetical protein GIB67_022091 [Kingdonia uniflora]|uniref:Endonuclease/exonuclease/phosphatase domain-containing protein n=1 Tax=Kingdonia uniflora TaxID=39325 RepID=A0A7J7MUI4_9MAGN|nr:hypothetical protein GIB67_022091 [Kingdonia uniflora]
MKGRKRRQREEERCFSESWEHHHALHERAAFTLNENGNEEEETSGKFDFGSSLSSSKPSIGKNPGLNNGSSHLYPTAIAERNNGATWLEVGCLKTYTPTVDDIGHILKFDCLGVNAKTKVAAGDTKTFLTSRVQSAPIPSPRCLISVSKVNVTGRLVFNSSSGTFTLLSYNILSDLYATTVLEPKFSNHLADPPGKKRFLCVANTHIHVHQDLMDVKLWQVQTLLRGLEKIALSADISKLVCGDFNSTPGNAPHTLLATLPLPLVSAYSSFAIPTTDPRIEKQKTRMDLKTNEPFFTNCTRDFLGTVDYIFYSADSLMVESLLELVDVGCLQRETGLPSPACSSDHIALLAEFRFMPRMRR